MPYENDEFIVDPDVVEKFFEKVRISEEAKDKLRRYEAEKEAENHIFDYLGHRIYGIHSSDRYCKCGSCGFYVWEDSAVLGLCPKCALNLPQFELEISFGKSPSAGHAIGLAKKIGGYTEEERNGKSNHVVKFRNLDEYNIARIEQNLIEDLIWTIWRWKSCEIRLNGNLISTQILRVIDGELKRYDKK